LLAEYRTCAMLLPLLLERYLNGLSLMYLRGHEAADFRCPSAGHDHRWHTGW
jgi:hypothetical protein